MSERDEDNGGHGVAGGGPPPDEYERLLGYYEHVVSYLRSCGLGEEARDIAQEVYIRVYKHWSDYRGHARWNYLKQIARRLALNAFRDRDAEKRRGIEVSPEILDDFPDDGAERPGAFIERDAIQQRLGVALDHLEPAQRGCVELFYFEELSYKEICQKLHISVPALKSRLNAARARMRELLGEEFEGWPAEPVNSGEES